MPEMQEIEGLRHAKVDEEKKRSVQGSRIQSKVPESGSTLHQLCIMVASCPSLRCHCRKRTVSCREAEGLATELSFPRCVRHNTVIVSNPRFGLQDIDCALTCDM